MKAILLAGGHGVRAKPFTDYLPKALIPVDGRPVIDYVVRYLAKFPEISDLSIVCEFDRFGKQIINYFEGKETLIGKSITFIEDKKNGTGGALLRVEKNLRQGSNQDDACFLVWFADNLCALKIDDMIRKYDAINNNSIGNTGYKGAIIGMVVVRDERFEETGRVVLEKEKDCDYNIGNDNNGIAPLIKEFIEKGKVKLERPEAVGIYLFSKRIFEYFHNESIERYDDGLCFDLSHDILEQIPRTGGKLFSFNLGENIEWIDIESPAYAERHKDIIKKVLSQMDVS
ncbi:MAG TPA: sugar phosphate nucleotidyltransferase [Nitrososphaeraceae archaeon]|nr:sugar phosphate nucleotidyltransferase [Nitrososphaeraceae archaeon]